MTEHDIISTINSTTKLEEILSKLDFDNQTYPNLEEHVVRYQIATKSEFKRAMAKAKRARKAINAIGADPVTPADFIEALMTTCAFKIDERSADPFTWYEPIRERRGKFDIDGGIREALNVNRNVLESRFADKDVTNEVIYFNDRQNITVVNRIFAKITQPCTKPFDWDTLVRTCFLDDNVSYEITIATLQKVIWQIKRKMAELDVGNHVMPMFFGAQGTGKTKFIQKMLAPLGNLSATTTFSQITDDRVVDLFAKYALFLDEMGKADSANADIVKNVISRDRFTYRKMGTGVTVEKDQNASFIGASNRMVGQLLHDPTGLRRFVQLDYTNDKSIKGKKARFAFINTIDFTEMWCSVDHLAADPIEPFLDELEALQDEHVSKSTVEEFADSVVEHCGHYRRRNSGDASDHMARLSTNVMSRDDIYLAYRDWCIAMHKKSPLETNQMIKELNRLRDIKREDFPFVSERRNSVRGYRYTGPSASPIVSKRGAR